MFDLLAALTLGYFAGSFPSAALIARLKGRNIFEVGSGNMGAMNTARHLGWAAGSAVLALDLAKGSLAVLLAGATGMEAGRGDETILAMQLAAGVGAVIGHGWSVFMRMRGGKALATSLGVALPVYPLAGAYGLLVLVGLTLVTRRSGLSAVITMIAYPFLSAAALASAGVPQERVFAVFTAVATIALVVIVKHVPKPGRGAA